MRVCLFSHEFPPFSYGGVGSTCSDLVRNLAKEGVEIDVVCGGRNTSALKFNDNEKIRVTTLPSYNMAPRLSFILSNLARPSLLRSLVGQADVVHAFSSIGILVGYIKKRTKKPVLGNVHGIPLRVLKIFLSSSFSSWTPGDFTSDFLEYPLSYILMEKMLRESDHIVVPSLHTLRDTLASYSLPIRKVSIIPNGVDFDALYFRSSIDSKAENDSNSICYCGRLTWIKGVTLLVKAYSILNKKIEDVSLKIIGWGPMGPFLRSLVSSLGLDQRVHFLGGVSRDKAIQEIRDSKFFVLPSLNENGPVAAYEAMALGKPVVAFDFPFARDFIFNNYNGLLARSCDIRDLSEKMLSLLTNEELLSKLGENAYAYVKEKHNWSINVKKYIKIYKFLSDI